MHKQVVSIAAILFVLGPAAGRSARLNCIGQSNVEDLRYSWHLRGAVSWIAGLVFPTSGVGTLKTTFPAPGEGDREIGSELLITPARGQSGYYVYQSQMDLTGEKTLMTYHGYAWGSRHRKETTVFDYVKRLARMRKETMTRTEDSVRPLPPESLRDVLTAIYYLRQNATTIKEPMASSIYSDGHEYPVVFRPAPGRTFALEGETVNALALEIVDAPGGKKWPGGVRVYLSDDSRRIPLRIEINEGMGSLQLDLRSVESCAAARSRT
jgi:Protein of unknown function (DUF3108)